MHPAYQIVEKGIVHIPEGRGLFSTLTVRENLELGAYTAQGQKVYPTKPCSMSSVYFRGSRSDSDRWPGPSPEGNSRCVPLHGD